MVRFLNEYVQLVSLSPSSLCGALSQFICYRKGRRPPLFLICTFSAHHYGFGYACKSLEKQRGPMVARKAHKKGPPVRFSIRLSYYPRWNGVGIGGNWRLFPRWSQHHTGSMKSDPWASYHGTFDHHPLALISLSVLV